MYIENEKPKKGERNHNYTGGRLAETKGQGEFPGNESHEADNDDSQRRYKGGDSYFAEERNAGGILSQLRKIKEAHLQYVNAHSERLKARLAEDEVHRKEVEREIAALENELRIIGLTEENKE